MSDTPLLIKEPPPIAYPSASAGDEDGKSARRLQKRTRQLQEAIAQIITELPRGVHITAPEIYRRARERGLSASLSTIYRLLNLMQEEGDVSTVAGEHGRRYEARDSEHDHDHLICLKCGLTIEFADELIRGFGKAVAERKGYDHKSSRFDIFGICGECKSKDDDHKIACCIDALESAMGAAARSMERLESVLALLQSRKTARAYEAMQVATRELTDAAQECQEVAETLGRSE